MAKNYENYFQVTSNTEQILTIDIARKETPIDSFTLTVENQNLVLRYADGSSSMDSYQLKLASENFYYKLSIDDSYNFTLYECVKGNPAAETAAVMFNLLSHSEALKTENPHPIAALVQVTPNYGVCELVSADGTAATELPAETTYQTLDSAITVSMTTVANSAPLPPEEPKSNSLISTLVILLVILVVLMAGSIAVLKKKNDAQKAALAAKREEELSRSTRSMPPRIPRQATLTERLSKKQMGTIDIPHYQEEPDDWIEQSQKQPQKPDFEEPAPAPAPVLPETPQEETFSEDEIQWVVPQMQRRAQTQEFPIPSPQSGSFYDDAAASVPQTAPVQQETPAYQNPPIQQEVPAYQNPPMPLEVPAPAPAPERDDLDADEWTRMKAAGIEMMFFKEERQFDGTWCLKPMVSGRSSFILWKEKDGILRIILSPLIYGSDDPFGGTGINIIKQFFEGADEFGGRITNMTPAMFEPADNTNSVYRCMRRGIIMQKEND